MRKIVVIGNGISGITAARHIRKHSDDRIVIISSESKYFFSRTALMYVFMGQMKFENTMPYEPSFYEKNRIDLLQGRVKNVDFTKKIVQLEKGQEEPYDELILAVGSKSRKLNVNGSELSNIQGLYFKQDLEQLESIRNQINKAVIVGGGLIGVELAEMLHYQGIEVNFLIRESAFWGNVLSMHERNMISQHLQSKGIRLHTNEEVDHFGGKEKVEYVQTKSGQRFECDFVGVTIGVEPNIEFLRNTELEVDKGIVINRKFETNISNVYAIGDCAQFKSPVDGRRNVEQIWYTGKIMGKTLGENLGKGRSEEYNPGPWYNSAKFFDIEYQNYGWITADLKPEEEEFIWEEGNKMIRVVFEKSTEKFVGINVFGLRLRHEVLDHWLRSNVKVDKVMANLKTVNFDAEFSKKHEEQIISKFNRDFNKSVSLKKKMWYQKLIRK